MLAILDDTIGRLDQVPQYRLALDRRQRAQILAVLVQDVEGDECEQLGVPCHARMHLLEVRPAVGLRRDHLAVDDEGLRGQLFSGIDHRPEPLRPVMAIPGEGARAGPVEDQLDTEAVIFDFVQPVVADPPAPGPGAVPAA